jgi:hypothetical protein
MFLQRRLRRSNKLLFPVLSRLCPRVRAGRLWDLQPHGGTDGGTIDCITDTDSNIAGVSAALCDAHCAHTVADNRTVLVTNPDPGAISMRHAGWQCGVHQSVLATV